MQSDQRSHAPTGDGADNGKPAHDAPAQHAAHDEQVPVDLPTVGTGGVVAIAVVLLVLFGGLFLLGWMPHAKKQAEAQSEATEAADARPVVNVTRPRRGNATAELVLPGDVRANQTTAIYARTNGYLKAPPDGIDIGARVNAGQVIAEISAPEVDAELEQAKASLEQANVVVGRATNEFNFNKSTYERYEGLSKTGGVTQQQLDERRSAFNIATSSLKAAQASVLAAKAAVKRLTELQGFQKVTAPFDGVITARNYDAGALISATATTPGRELFRLDQTDTLRIYVNVPQGYATDVKPGQTAELLVRNYPRRPFAGTVARTAGAIDPATRTMRVEVDVPNTDGKLFPGMYGQLRFKIPRDQPSLVLPTSAFVFNADGMRVAVLDGDRVRFRPVAIGRDFGSEAEVASGVNAEDQVVTNPGEHLVDGGEVKVNAPKTKTAAAANTPPGEQPRASAQQGGGQ